MAKNDAEFMRSMLTILQESAAGFLGDSHSLAHKSSVAQRLALRLWSQFMQKEGLDYNTVNWQHITEFLSDPHLANSLMVFDTGGQPSLTVQQIESLVSDWRVRRAIVKGNKLLDIVGANKPLSQILPTAADVSADGQPISTARAKRAEMIVMSILEAAVVAMFRKANDLE